MDGLLFDTERLYFDAMMMTASEMDALLTPEIIYSTVGLPAADCNAIWGKHSVPASM